MLIANRGTNVVCLKTVDEVGATGYGEPLGGSSPFCAITGIANNIRYTSQTQHKVYGEVRN